MTKLVCTTESRVSLRTRKALLELPLSGTWAPRFLSCDLVGNRLAASTFTFENTHARGPTREYIF